MEIRTLRYFLAIALEESFSSAGERVLFVTQPTLSRQMRELEDELGKKLFRRSGRKTLLTEAGRRFKKRAEEILELVDRTHAELRERDDCLEGTLHIGGGESPGMRFLGRVFRKMRTAYPLVKLELFSGNSSDVCEKLDRGLLDFGVLVEPADKEKYDYLSMPQMDSWGVLVKRNSALSVLESVSPEVLAGKPLILSRQSIYTNEFCGWFGKFYSKLNVVASYNLLYNASLLVKENVGVALCLKGIAGSKKSDGLKFVPLSPPRNANQVLVWKRNASVSGFSRPAEKFLEIFRREIGL